MSPGEVDAATGPAPGPGGRWDVAAQFVDVGVAGEHRDAGPPLVRECGRPVGVVVAAELDEGVDPGAQGAFVVGVLLQGPVGVGQGAREVVPRGGEGGPAGQRLVVVGRAGPGTLEGLLGLRVAGGVALGAGLLDVGEPEGGPAAEVPGLARRWACRARDARVEVAAGEQPGETARRSTRARRAVRAPPRARSPRRSARRPAWRRTPAS